MAVWDLRAQGSDGVVLDEDSGVVEVVEVGLAFALAEHLELLAGDVHADDPCVPRSAMGWMRPLGLCDAVASRDTCSTRMSWGRTTACTLLAANLNRGSALPASPRTGDER